MVILPLSAVALSANSISSDNAKNCGNSLGRIFVGIYAMFLVMLVDGVYK
jgi:hypothetical protein